VHAADSIAVTALPLPRVFFPDGLTAWGPALGEGLDLEVGDMDDQLRRVQYAVQAKGGKDRYVPLPELTLQKPTTVLDDPPAPALAVPKPFRQRRHPLVRSRKQTDGSQWRAGCP